MSYSGRRRSRPKGATTCGYRRRSIWNPRCYECFTHSADKRIEFNSQNKKSNNKVSKKVNKKQNKHIKSSSDKKIKKTENVKTKQSKKIVEDQLSKSGVNYNIII